jgi:hypothetical protein
VQKVQEGKEGRWKEEGLQVRQAQRLQEVPQDPEEAVKAVISVAAQTKYGKCLSKALKGKKMNTTERKQRVMKAAQKKCQKLRKATKKGGAAMKTGTSVTVCDGYKSVGVRSGTKAHPAHKRGIMPLRCHKVSKKKVSGASSGKSHYIAGTKESWEPGTY